jgi:hypothetical protein
VSLEHFLNRVAERQVGVAHDPCDLGPARSGTLLSQLYDELGFADRPQMPWAISAVLGVTFQIHRANNVVPGTSVGVKVAEAVGPASVALVQPQVVMGIADR